MRHLMIMSVVLSLIATACGGGSLSEGAISGTSWCDGARGVEAASSALEDPTAPGISEFAGLLNDLAPSAPAEIKADVDLMVAFINSLDKAVQDNDGNILLAMDSMGSDLFDPKLEDASDRIEAYNERECGIIPQNDEADTSGFPEDDPDADFPMEGGLIAGLAETMGITEDEARCLVEQVDFLSDTEPSASDIMDAFDTCGMDPFGLGG